MVTLGRMKVTLDVGDYYRLPSDVRARLDVWLEAETLKERKVVKLTLGEAVVTIERLAVNDEGKHYLDENGDVATVIETVPIRTMPPKEAFDA